MARVLYKTLRDKGIIDVAVCQGLHRAVRTLRDGSIKPENSKDNKVKVEKAKDKEVKDKKTSRKEVKDKEISGEEVKD